jgi:uncharacterized protein
VKKSTSKKTVNKIKRAANGGDAKAQTLLGIIYFRGGPVRKNYKKALHWFRKALKNKTPWTNPLGLRHMYFCLGFHYYFGFAVRRNYKKAFLWHRAAAKAGNKTAQVLVGDMYCDGRAVRPNYKKAFEFYMMAASSGDAQGQFEVGLAYLDGIGVKRDHKQGMYWIQKAADAGIADAQAKVGMACFEAGDRKKAVKLISEAADKGSFEGLYYLASLYWCDDGIGHDAKKAVSLYRKAARTGQPGCEAADLYLGMAYNEGKGVRKNKQLAIKHFQIAAKAGSKPAQQFLSEYKKLEKK